MRNVLIILVISVALLLVGCGTEQNPNLATTKAFIGGTEGIVASFDPLSVKENNIYTIFNTEDFSLDIVLRNKGEEDLLPQKASLRLLGPAPTSFRNIPLWQLQNKEKVEKLSEFNPQGGEEIVSFTPTDGALYTEPVTGSTDVTWNLEYTYDYKTHLIADNVCFKGDITDEKVCTVKEVKPFSVSGAPIQVTSVTEDVAGKGIILLRVDVKNVGVGKATIVGQGFDTRFDQVGYTIDEPTKWECKSGGRENEARLVGGVATVICRLRQPLDENDLYTKSVRLTFDYTYKDLVQEKLRIKESIQ